MKKQKRYKICRGLFFLVFLLAIGTRLAFWGMAAEKESAETQTGAAGAYYGGMLTKDLGTILVGKEAVRQGLIDEVGGISAALEKLRSLMAD